MPREIAKREKHHLNELKEMVQEGKEPVEKVFAVFCQRHGVSMGQCRKYYDKLVADGEVKEK